jgi:hypothetical protein
LLTLTTKLTRIALPVIAFLVWTPAALAWTWPVQGPVLQVFSYDEAHPYAAGQHRGIDIGADATGEAVVAPAAGTVSFAGSVPTNGKSVTIQTPDGYSVTLTHLGSIVVVKGAAVGEGDEVGTVGPSGTPEVDSPYVHLGIRVTADQNGYVDPLGLLPPAAATTSDDTGTTASQPASSGGSSTAPASKPVTPAKPRPRPEAKRESSPKPRRSDVSTQERRRAKESREEAEPTRSPHRSAVKAGNEADIRMQRHAPVPRPRASQPANPSRRPVVEPAALREPTGLDTGHEVRPSPPMVRPEQTPTTSLSGLLCDGAAVLFAVGAAFAADRRRRRSRKSPTAGAQVLRLPPPAVDHSHATRAA